MCGIVGYVGHREAAPIILKGLQRLEYRGYDSAGLAVNGNGSGMNIRRAVGKIVNLEHLINGQPITGSCGIGHTRWATHGQATVTNAHPHTNADGKIAIVHNGIVENHLDLKVELEDLGYESASQTDSEVIAHLIDHYAKSEATLEQAVCAGLRRLRGVFALAVVSCHDPQKVVVARSGPPVVIGVGKNEFFLASDVPAILEHTRDVCFLMDGDVAVLTPNGVRMHDVECNTISRPLERVSLGAAASGKDGFQHFMQKEIFEQPNAVRETLQAHALGRSNVGARSDEQRIQWLLSESTEQVRIVACGTSWHAGLIGKYMIERLARIPVEVDYGSEFRYREPIVNERTLTIAVSQSGETADTLAALREATTAGSKTLTICNVSGSMLAREAQAALYTHAGPEIGVASTKAFTTQLAVLFVLAVRLAAARGRIPPPLRAELEQELSTLPLKIETVLSQEQRCRSLARKFYRSRSALFLGRGIHFPVALEGALKLKEISYVHAEGYPAGEMKHGPNALIDENLPVVAIATHDPRDARSEVRYQKTVGNIEEVQARRGHVIGLGITDDELLPKIVDDLIEVPHTHELLLPILEIIPLQLLAYHIAVLRGCDVDCPRNLAKSVTVE